MSTAPVKRILVATDFSEGAERALAAALELGESLGAAIDLVHVVAMPVPNTVSLIIGIGTFVFLLSGTVGTLWFVRSAWKRGAHQR